jgi:hypothetical protein
MSEPRLTIEELENTLYILEAHPERSSPFFRTLEGTLRELLTIRKEKRARVQAVIREIAEELSK